MAAGKPRIHRGRSFLLAATLALLTGPSQAAEITFPGSGALESCLETAVSKWVQVQAELQVNEDPASRKVGDVDVAAWTRATLDTCRKQVGTSNKASEEIFTRYMSRWREHVFDLASSIRRRGQSD
jgi:hypothetical protein